MPTAASAPSPTARLARRGDTTFVQTLRRRAVSVPAVVFGLVVVAPLLVAALPLLATFDLLRGERRLPRARLAVFGIWYLAWEVAAVLAAVGLWVATGFGRRTHSEWSQARHAALQAAWVTSILGAAQRILDLDLDVEGSDCLVPDADAHSAGAPLIVLCRHASMVDTLVPAKLLFDQGYRVRYVLKDELLWDPALDIIGHRLPNCFIDRSSPDMAAEIDGIGALAAGAGPNEALVIFPEGTRWSPEKRERAIARLRETEPARAERAERLVATMPPRAAGTLALLAGRPDADVVIVSHTGLEGLAGPGAALRLLPLRRPMQVSLRRIARSDVPDGAAAQTAWLLDQWDQVDAWIRAARPA